MSDLNKHPAVAVPDILALDTVLPDEPLLMMGAGPVPIPDRVAKANSIVINHLGGTMTKVIGQVKSMARYVFQTQSEWVMGVAGPGSAAMEMAICNLVIPDGKVLSICNGFFSNRMAEMARRCGGQVTEVSITENTAARVDDIRSILEKERPTILTLVQGETSNTVYNRHLKEITALAKEYDCMVIVDAICTLSTMQLEMDGWGVDAIISGGQKGLSSIPGVSLLAFSEQAWQHIQQRQQPVVQWCLDAKLASNFWHDSGYHYTAPVSGILALHEALRLVCEETLSVRFARHQRCSMAMQNGIQAMGLSLFVAQESRLNSVVGISVPEGMSGKEICSHISRVYQVEIAGSFGQPIVRIGQMGEQCRVHNLFRTLHALGSTMRDLGVAVDLPSGMAEMESLLQNAPVT